MATGRIGVTPTLRTRWSKQPTAGTTSLSGLDDNSVSLVYDVGYEAVYRNGVLLSRGNDYTATSGTSITLIDATLTGDIVEVFANDLVPLTDAISKGQFTAKGALLSATAASTPGVLTVGSNDQVLTADSTTSTGLKWATPAAGGMTLINTGGTTLTGGSVTISSIPSTYRDLQLVIRNFRPNSGGEFLWMRYNGDSNNRYKSVTAGTTFGSFDTSIIQLSEGQDSTTSQGLIVSTIYDYANTATWKMETHFGLGNRDGSPTSFTYRILGGFYDQTAAISSITIGQTGASFNSGTAFLYGVK